MVIVAEYPRFGDCIVVPIDRCLRIIYSCRDLSPCWHWRHRPHHQFEPTVLVAAVAAAVAAVARFVVGWEECIERFEVEFVEKYAKRYRNANFVPGLRHW